MRIALRSTAMSSAGLGALGLLFGVVLFAAASFNPWGIVLLAGLPIFGLLVGAVLGLVGGLTAGVLCSVTGSAKKQPWWPSGACGAAMALTTAIVILRSDPEFQHPEAMSMAAAAFGWGVLVDRISGRHRPAQLAVASN